MIVQVGFLCGLVTNGPASATKRFFTSWAWHYSFRTEVAGSSPMRVVPASWMISPPGWMPVVLVLAVGIVAQHLAAHLRR